MKNPCILIFIALSILSNSCKKKPQKETTPVIPPKEVVTTPYKSLNYLYTISGKKTVAGQEARQYWKPMFDISTKYPALWGEDLSFFPFGGTKTMAEWRTLITLEAKQRWAEGALISMMFHACPPTQPEPCDWETGIKSKLSDSQWNELITDGTALNNNWKARLDVIAPYLQELKTAGVEVLFRPFHEMNQNAFWWGGRPGASGTRKLYQLTHDYLVKTKSLNNLIWVWNIQDFSSLAADVDSYDPGKDYWDMLTLDIYGSDGAGFTTNKYNIMVKKAAGKPIAIGECGKLPTSDLLAEQPKWTFFMGWAELTQQQNTNSEISGLYQSGNVVTLDKMPKW
jgi:mannan endo-1,4-beta-mannosidase